MNIKSKSIHDLIDDRLHNRIRGQGWRIDNAASDTATLRIYDEIGFFGVTAEEIAQALDEVTAPNLEVQISSLGGDVFDGIAIYNALRAHSATVTTRVDSMAASIASVIAQAGDRRVMLSGSQMMVHEAWGIAIGNSTDMRSLADVLDKQTGIIAGIYAERSGQEKAAMQDMMVGETWMDAQETVDAGLADEVVNPSDVPVDRFDKPRFSDRLASVLTDVERIAEETEDVLTFRSQQGKAPLSDESSELVERAVAALGRLTGVLTPEEAEANNTNLTPFYAELEERRYRLKGAS